MSDRTTIRSAWTAHSGSDWPQFSSPHQGELMTLDTVISGCVVYYLASPDGLDEQRIAIVNDCLEDLDDLTGELDTEAQPYFHRLRELGNMLLKADRSV